VDIAPSDRPGSRLQAMDLLAQLPDPLPLRAPRALHLLHRQPVVALDVLQPPLLGLQLLA
jgi:hypothetical protein